MKKSSDKIIIANIIVVAAITVILNFIAYNAEEAKGIGFLYFGLIALIINIVLLLALAISSFIMSKKETGKSLLVSVLLYFPTYKN